MPPLAVKTEIWRELMNSLSARLNAPIICGQAFFGKLSFFQELRNRKSDSPFSSISGVKYVSVEVDDQFNSSIRKIPVDTKFVLAFAYTYLQTSFSEIEQSSDYSDDNPSLLKRDLRVLYQRFLI